MKNILSLTIFLGLISCSSKDEQFCKCLKSGEELNQFSSNLFNKNVTPELQKKMQNLRNKKSKACQNYLKMDGKKMLELKSSCK